MVLGIVLGLIGGIVGLKLVSKKGSSMENTVFNERLTLLKDQNKELKRAVAISNGTIGNMKKGITLDDDVNLEKLDESGFDGVITSLISKYQGMAPPQLRPFLQDPAIVSFLLDQAKKNPEQTKEVLKHFIGKNGKIATESGENDSQQVALQLAREEGA